MRHINTNQLRQLPDVLQQQQQGQQNNTITPSTSSTSNVRKIAQDLQGKTNFNPIAKPRNMHLVTPPTYTAPNKTHKQLLNMNSNLIGDSAAAAAVSMGLTDSMEMDMRGAMALPINRSTTDAGSNHSGGSNETVQIDDVIQYADT